MITDQDPRARLLRSLIELAAELGYPNLTLPELLERASVSHADFHRHFSDIDDCCRVAVAECTQDFLARVGHAFSQGESWVEQLRFVGYEMQRFLREDQARARFMVLEVPGAGRGAVDVREQGIRALTALIDAGRNELDDPDAVPSSAAAIVAGTAYNRIHVGVENGVETLTPEMVRELMFSSVLPYRGLEAALAELDMPEPPKLDFDEHRPLRLDLRLGRR